MDGGEAHLMTFDVNLPGPWWVGRDGTRVVGTRLVLRDRGGDERHERELHASVPEDLPERIFARCLAIEVLRVAPILRGYNKCNQKGGGTGVPRGPQIVWCQPRVVACIDWYRLKILDGV